MIAGHILIEASTESEYERRPEIAGSIKELFSDYVSKFEDKQGKD